MNQPHSSPLINLLYWNSPLGCPDKRLTIGMEFEVGGTYEDWGFVAYWEGSPIVYARSPEQLYSKVYEYFNKNK